MPNKQLLLPGLEPQRPKSSSLLTCPACGQHNHHLKTTLKFLYWQQRLSSKEIGKLYSVSGKTISKHLASLGIQHRSTSEVRKLIHEQGRSNLPKAKQRDNHPRWKGGRYSRNGYVFVTIYEDNPYYCMGMKNTGIGKRILEHRLVMAEKLGRPLARNEHVHHINGIRDDNRPENLKLISPKSHSIYNELCAHCELRKEIRLLRWQVKELTTQLQGKFIPDGDPDHA